MADKSATPAKEGFFAGISSEFKKIIWPTRIAVAKETTAVVVVSVVVGLIIALLDYVIQYGVDVLIKL